MVLAWHSTSTAWCGWARQPIPGAADAVARLRAAGERVVFCTNNSIQPVAAVEAKLARHGIPAEGDVHHLGDGGGRAARARRAGARVRRARAWSRRSRRRGAMPGARGARRRRAGGLPPRLRLRAAAGRRRRGARGRPAAGHQRRRHLSDARRARSRAVAPSWPPSSAATGVTADRGRQALRTDGRSGPGPAGADGHDGGGPPRHRRALRRRARLALRPRADPASRRRPTGVVATGRPRRRRPGRALVDDVLRLADRLVARVQCANSCKHPVTCSMAQNDILKRYLDAGIAFTALTQARAEALVKDLVKAGEVQAEQARERRGRPRSSAAARTARSCSTGPRARCASQITSLGLVSKADLDRFEKRIAELFGAAAKPAKAAGQEEGAGQEGAAEEGSGQEGRRQEGAGQEEEGHGQEGCRPRRLPPRSEA